MSIMQNTDGSRLFISDADPNVTSLDAAGKTDAQYAADYVTFQGTWPLAWWKAQRLADNLNYMTGFVNWPNFIDNGTVTTVSAAAVGNFIAAVANNYRTKRNSINAAATSAACIAIDVSTGYPANP